MSSVWVPGCCSELGLSLSGCARPTLPAPAASDGAPGPLKARAWQPRQGLHACTASLAGMTWPSKQTILWHGCSRRPMGMASNSHTRPWPIQPPGSLRSLIFLPTEPAGPGPVQRPPSRSLPASCCTLALLTEPLANRSGLPQSWSDHTDCWALNAGAATHRKAAPLIGQDEPDWRPNPSSRCSAVPRWPRTGPMQDCSCLAWALTSRAGCTGPVPNLFGLTQFDGRSQFYGAPLLLLWLAPPAAAWAELTVCMQAMVGRPPSAHAQCRSPPAWPHTRSRCCRRRSGHDPTGAARAAWPLWDAPAAECNPWMQGAGWAIILGFGGATWLSQWSPPLVHTPALSPERACCTVPSRLQPWSCAWVQAWHDLCALQPSSRCWPGSCSGWTSSSPVGGGGHATLPLAYAPSVSAAGLQVQQRAIQHGRQEHRARPHSGGRGFPLGACLPAYSSATHG